MIQYVEALLLQAYTHGQNAESYGKSELAAACQNAKDAMQRFSNSRHINDEMHAAITQCDEALKGVS